MRYGLCPECGQEPRVHTGWGAIGCSLSDHGVTERIWEFRQAPEHIIDPKNRELTFCGRTASFQRSTGDLDATVTCRECRKGSNDMELGRETQ